MVAKIVDTNVMVSETPDVFAKFWGLSCRAEAMQALVSGAAFE